MTQHAVLGLVKSSVVQLKGSGIRINIVSSGTIDMGIELSKVHEADFAGADWISFKMHKTGMSIGRFRILKSLCRMQSILNELSALSGQVNQKKWPR